MTGHKQSLEDWIFKSLAIVGTLVNILSNIPRILKLHRVKDTRHVSTRAYIMNISGLSMITIYAFHFNLWEIFFPNIIMICQWIYILIIKYWFLRKYRNLGILDQQLLRDEIDQKLKASEIQYPPVDIDETSLASSDMVLSPPEPNKLRL